MNKKLNKFDADRILFWSALITVFLLNCFLIAKRGTKLLDSDMSSELLLSNILAGEKRFITDSWYYSTELRVLNTQLIFAPLFMIFDCWHTVRTAGSIILWIILAVSAYYFCRQADLKKYFPVISAFLLLPISETYYYVVVLGVYYIPHISISFFTLGMCLQFANSQKISAKYILPVLVFTLSLLAGMGGLRQLLILYIPLMITAVIMCRLKKGKKSVMFLLSSVVAVSGSVAGYIINSKILSNSYNFHNYNDIEFTTLSIKNIFDCISDVFVTLGYRTGNVFSFAILHNISSLILVISAIIAVIYIIKSKTATYGKLVLAVFFIDFIDGNLFITPRRCL